MGTSSAYGGPGNSTPLIPSWLEPDGEAAPPEPNETSADGDGASDGAPDHPEQEPLPDVLPNTNRFTVPRTNFTRFVRSGGSDRASLGRAVSGYVSRSSGGARNAARRMGSTRRTGRQLLGFLSDVVTQGARQALSALNLESLAGRPIDEIFLGLVDYICPDGGTVDEGIARDAFIETIADLVESGITDLDALTPDQMQTFFELHTAHAIQTRICNDIGAQAILLPEDVRTATSIQDQIYDFVRRGVADALTRSGNAINELTADNIQQFVDQIYEDAFAILRSLGEREAVL